MILNWKRRALELTKIVNCHRKDRLHRDMLQAWELATELIELDKKEKKLKKKFLEWWKCKDKKRSQIIYDEYLELVRKCY
jgi:hypothetical protein